jgi:hypothetical protein
MENITSNQFISEVILLYGNIWLRGYFNLRADLQWRRRAARK